MRLKCLIGHHYFAVDSIRETLDGPGTTRGAAACSRGAWRGSCRGFSNDALSRALHVDEANARVSGLTLKALRARGVTSWS